MSALANALRQITKKAAHPNALLYQVQLDRAKKRHLIQGQLGDGLAGVVALKPPEEGGEADIEGERSRRDEAVATQKDVEDVSGAVGNGEGVEEKGKDGGSC